MLYCVVDLNPYQLSCPGREQAAVSCTYQGSSSLSLEKRAVLGVVDLFVVPLPFYLVVDT